MKIETRKTGHAQPGIEIRSLDCWPSLLTKKLVSKARYYRKINASLTLGQTYVFHIYILSKQLLQIWS